MIHCFSFLNAQAGKNIQLHIKNKKKTIITEKSDKKTKYFVNLLTSRELRIKKLYFGKYI